jgi:hypothetical protein
MLPGALSCLGPFFAGRDGIPGFTARRNLRAGRRRHRKRPARVWLGTAPHFGSAGDDARKLGATDVLITTDDKQMDQARGRFDLILDTISAPHHVPPLLRLAALDGTLSLLGYPGEIPLRIMDLIYGRKKLTSSGTGGRRGTAELLTFSAEHGITADIELLPHPASRRRSTV